MATTRVQIAASPDEVFAVLADLEAYARWVVGSDTGVTLIETAADPLSCLVFNPITDSLVHVRNVESRRRLRRIAESRTPR